MSIAEETPPPLNEYSYLETGGFSSEKFKVEVNNLPKFYGISEFRKLLTTKLSLNPVKVKPPYVKSRYLYVCFPNDEERNKALSTLDGFKWKGNVLKCTIALPTPDPLVKKRKLDAEENEIKKVDTRSQSERLKETAIPYWNMPYEEQVDLKNKLVKTTLVKLANELWKVNSNLKNYIKSKRDVHDGLLFEFGPMKTANVTEGYRNKCEFTIATDIETGLPTIGFRLSTYSSGFTGVAPIGDLCHISDEMKKVVLLFQEFVRKSNYKVYSPEDHSGYWRQLAVRQSMTSGDLMLIVSINIQDMVEEDIEKLKTAIIQFLTVENASFTNIKSLYFLTMAKRKRGENSLNIQHIYGETHIHDCIHGLKFRISPQAFFQININAAEILYQQAIDLSQVKKESTVLDICCGTGTIGLCFAKHCNQVLGLEIVPEAVTDAKENAKVNNISNADFFIGKAEDILTSVAARSTSKDIIAIVDPPRSGLHMRAIVQLRRMKNVKKLVYISCDPNAAFKNFIDLGRMSSKTMHGDPFIPTRAVAVDMFPHTKHTELVLLFERIKSDELNIPQPVQTTDSENVDSQTADSVNDVKKETCESPSPMESDNIKTEIE